MRPVELSSSVELASAAKDVWPFITDTDRANRLVGGRPVSYEAIEPGSTSSARFVAKTEAGGFNVTYEEAPFEWTLNRSFSVVRRMRGGPISSYTYGLTLEPLPDGGTRSTVKLSLMPRHWLLAPIVRVQAKGFVRGFADLAREIDAHLQKNAASPYDAPRSPANEEGLARSAKVLAERSVSPAVIEKMLGLLRDGPDADLIRVRPFEVAKEWDLPRSDVLRGFLHAVTTGLFELRWALVCPSCRTASVEVESLDGIGDSGHCQMCDISYGVELDRAVEATFIAHPGIREVKGQMFCMGGPARTPHVLVQKNLEVGETARLAAPEELGRYRLFARGGALATLELADDAPAEVSVSILSDEHMSADALRVRPGGEVLVKNATELARHVKLERLTYANLAATAHEVTLMSEFRRLFSRDLLKPRTPLKVASAALLFSDLTGSTALYSSVGDATAFRLVDDHFDVLRAALDPHGGTVVKTMGDAVMAAFADPIAAVSAACECLRRFEDFRKSAPHGELVGLKLGIFSGPCYVVTANGAIDYFGQTVNCAARVQHLAHSGELVLERSLYEALSPEKKGALRVLEELTTSVKGVEHPLELVRTALA